MKTERRHELQTNVLASSLAHWTEAAQPYGKAVLAGVLAIIIALFAWLYISSQSSHAHGGGLERLLSGREQSRSTSCCTTLPSSMADRRFPSGRG